MCLTPYGTCTCTCICYMLNICIPLSCCFLVVCWLLVEVVTYLTLVSGIAFALSVVVVVDVMLSGCCELNTGTVETDTA